MPSVAEIATQWEGKSFDATLDYYNLKYEYKEQATRRLKFVVGDYNKEKVKYWTRDCNMNYLYYVDSSGYIYRVDTVFTDRKAGVAPFFAI